MNSKELFSKDRKVGEMVETSSKFYPEEGNNNFTGEAFDNKGNQYNVDKGGSVEVISLVPNLISIGTRNFLGLLFLIFMFILKPFSGIAILLLTFIFGFAIFYVISGPVLIFAVLSYSIFFRRNFSKRMRSEGLLILIGIPSIIWWSGFFIDSYVYYDEINEICSQIEDYQSNATFKDGNRTVNITHELNSEYTRVEIVYKDDFEFRPSFWDQTGKTDSIYIQDFLDLWIFFFRYFSELLSIKGVCTNGVAMYVVVNRAGFSF